MFPLGFKGPSPDQASRFEGMLPRLREAGFTWMEVLAPEEENRGWEERLRAWQEEYGIRLAVHARFFGVNLASPNPHIRQAAWAVAAEDIAFAVRVGAGRINFHAGDLNWYDVPPPDHPEHQTLLRELHRLRAQFLESAGHSLNRVAGWAHDAGLVPLVENLYRPWELVRTPEEARAFLAPLPPFLGFTLDTGHALLAGHSPTEFLEALGERVAHLHLHTNDGAYDFHAFPDPEHPAIAAMLRALPSTTAEAVLLIEITPGTHHGSLEKFCAWPRRLEQDDRS